MNVLPNRHSIERALLEILADGHDHRDTEIYPALLKRFELDEEGLPVFKSG